VSVAIVDSGGANISSVRYALARLGVEASLTRDAAEIRRADRVLLPGVGAAADAMARLRSAGLDTLIPSLTQPVLGICLGMQLLFDRSAEGDSKCLGIFRGCAERFPDSAGLPVPHMGWNSVRDTGGSRLLAGIDDDSYFYFVHSYAVPVVAATTGLCEYGHAFTAVAERENFYATQFHPERSGDDGARLLRNFLGLDGG
jgi:glutamine amidotransferase